MRHERHPHWELRFVFQKPSPEAFSLRVPWDAPQDRHRHRRLHAEGSACDTARAGNVSTRDEQVNSDEMEKTRPHRKTPAKQSRSGQMRQEQIMPLQKTLAVMSSLSTG
jgi:hypothetical protein